MISIVLVFVSLALGGALAGIGVFKIRGSAGRMNVCLAVGILFLLFSIALSVCIYLANHADRGQATYREAAETAEVLSPAPVSDVSGSSDNTNESAPVSDETDATTSQDVSSEERVSVSFVDEFADLSAVASIGSVTEDAAAVYEDHVLSIDGQEYVFPILSTSSVYEGAAQIITYPKAQYVSVTYADSHLQVGDLNNMQIQMDYLEEKAGDYGLVIGEFTYHDYTGYVCYYEDVVGNDGRVIMIYEDIEAGTYLSIQIQDYKKQYQVDDLVDAYLYKW